VVSNFAKSSLSRVRAKLETLTTLTINNYLVSCDSEIRPVLDITFMRISESGHQR